MWLQSNLLTKENVLEYFSFSQFYDRNCNNEVLKMQTKHSVISGLEKMLEKMCGTQYVVQKSEDPQLFIIKKQQRVSPEKAFVIDYYYVMNGTVYQAQIEKEIVKTRYTNILFSMLSTLKVAFHRAPAPAATTAGAADKKKASISARLPGLFNLFYTDQMNEEDEE